MSDVNHGYTSEVMQVGFSMLEVGSVSPKNTKTVLIKNLADTAIGAICWWFLGYGFAYGEDVGGFIGTDNFGLQGPPFKGEAQGTALANWFFQGAFAASAATVVSGAVAERMKIASYMLFSIWIIFVVYPVVVHWAWSEGGWASSFRCQNALTEDEYKLCRDDSRDLFLGCGVADFAGSGVVHMTGGICALVAAIVVQPRSGKFRLDGSTNRLPQQSPALQTLGAMILWVGWYGFNGGSVGSVSNGRSALVAKSMVNTTVAAGSSVLSMGLLLKTLYKKFDSSHLNNGIISGLVAISGSGPLVQPEGAFIIGVFSSAFYLIGVEGLLWFKIDDVVHASVVHLGCGMWGLVAAGLLTTKDGYRDVYSFGVMADPTRDNDCCGLFYGCSGKMLAANLIFMSSVLMWAALLAYVALRGIQSLVGLRITMDVEKMGMDGSRNTRNVKSTTALRQALRFATGIEDKNSAASSRRPSCNIPAPQIPHWRESCDS